MSVAIENVPSGSTNFLLNASVYNQRFLTYFFATPSPATTINLVGTNVTSGTVDFYPIITNASGSTAAKLYIFNFKNLTMPASSTSGSYTLPSSFVPFTGSGIVSSIVSGMFTINIAANAQTFTLTSSSAPPSNVSATVIVAGP
jgi:hypothetical protein